MKKFFMILVCFDFVVPTTFGQADPAPVKLRFYQCDFPEDNPHGTITLGPRSEVEIVGESALYHNFFLMKEKEKEFDPNRIVFLFPEKEGCDSKVLRLEDQYFVSVEKVFCERGKCPGCVLPPIRFKIVNLNETSVTVLYSTEPRE